MKRRLLFCALCLLATQNAGAQSLFGTRGLGVPVDPFDPRARALGNLGLGLGGLNTSLVNPAELSGNLRRGVAATLQPYYGNEQLGGADENVASTRFPVIHIIYPFRQRWVLGLGYGGVLDQTWGAIVDGTEILGSDTVNSRDLISAAGALAQVRVSVSYAVNQRLAVGAAAGLFTGSLERALTRTFPDSVVSLDPFTFGTTWNYGGKFATLGVRADPRAGVRLSGALTWSGTLDATPASGDSDTEYSYDLPIRATFGGSALVTRRLMATASAQWTGWSNTSNYAAPGSPADVPVAGRSTIEAGVGLEWEQIRTARRVYPLRVGYRYAQLPFHLDNDDAAKESALSAGLGFRLAGDEFGPLAVADIGVERGRRSGWNASINGGLKENFWRASFSIALFGR